MEDRVTELQAPDLSQAPKQDALLTHPEEMKAAFNLRIGDKISLQGSARLTPAGVVSAGVALSAVLLSVGFILWAGRKRGQ